ncbi:MAG: selenide, water dikinase SelD [Hyphomicrobiales bacterium]
MQKPIPQTRDIVLVGGGHTHALVLRMWGMKPLPGVRLTLIDPAPTTSYSGMLPGFIAGHYEREELEIDLVRLARFAGARLILSRAESLDLDKKQVAVAGRPPVGFDLLSLDVGAHGNLADIPGFDQYGVAAKPLDLLAEHWTAFRDTLKQGAKANAVVIGAGVAGTELAMAMHFGARKKGADLDVVIVDRSVARPNLLSSTIRLLQDSMAAAGIRVLDHQDILKVEKQSVFLGDGTRLPADITVGAGGPRPYAWLGRTGLATEAGYVCVGPTLQSVTDESVFAVGDCAHLAFAPRPKAGVYAVRAAPILYANLRAALDAGRWRRFRPQRNYLKLISMGSKTAVADKRISLSGRWLWHLKHWIDQRFMEQFQKLEPMRQRVLPARSAPGVAEMLNGPNLCGGCGAKVGPATLGKALSGISSTRSDIVTGAGDDAAVLVAGDERLVITTDHLRAFTDDPYVMTRIAANHALGDVFAMGAEPQAALPAITLPALSNELQARTLDEVMRAANEVFSEAGADIVGGHTSVGAEFSVGFTVTGTTSSTPNTLNGAQEGDVLILTKPIGTGVIMAAEMVMAAKGRDVANALTNMQLSSAKAAEVLVDAHAMTDVTGFGLAGHLFGMLKASSVAAVIDLDKVPILSGAEDLAERGFKSSLNEQNFSHAGPFVEMPDATSAQLLYDPQTAGGLLASVSRKKAEKLVNQLTDCGYEASAIGHIVAGTPGIAVKKTETNGGL